MNSLTEDFTRGFFKYQLDWLNDPSPFKIGLWARQTGKDFTCTAEAVLDCMQHDDRHWIILACGERQARESLEKAREWARRLRFETEDRTRARLEPPRESATELRWRSGSRITALPAKPGTVRGGEKKLRVISTPNGQGDFFHRLWTHCELFSKHRTTIHQARADGLKLEIEQLKAGIADAEAWAQEYECEFLDRSTVLLPYELIESCEAREATESGSMEELSRHRGDIFLGIDFGRKQDLTVCWVLERLGAELWTREVLALQRMPTPEQFDALAPRVALARKVCVDYTGAGIGLGDMFAERFGRGRLELCTFTAGLKEEIFSKLRAAFERRKIWVPGSSAVREDLHAMQRVVSPNGQISFRASHTADGHSDRCAALALALRAAESAPVTACAANVGSGYRRR